MLPPVTAAAAARAFVEFLGGGVWGGSADLAAWTAPYVFALHLAAVMRLVGLAPSRFSAGWGGFRPPCRRCAVCPDKGRVMSCLLAFLPAASHAIAFCGGVACGLVSRDNACDLVLAFAVLYALHRLLLRATMTAVTAGAEGHSAEAAAIPVINDCWKRSLPWVLKTNALVLAAAHVLGCTAFQHRFLVLLCAHAFYVINGHEGIVSPAWASALLSSGTALACASA